MLTYGIEVLIVCWQGRAEEILRAIFPSKSPDLEMIPSRASLGMTETESNGTVDPTSSRTTMTDGGSRSIANLRPLRGSSSAPPGGSFFKVSGERGSFMEVSGERGTAGLVAGGGAMSGVKVMRLVMDIGYRYDIVKIWLVMDIGYRYNIDSDYYRGP